MQNYVLAAGLNSFTGKADRESVKLSWEFSPENIPAEFNVEFSSDQVMFNTISTIRSVPGKGQYSFSFSPNDNSDLFYRIRYVNHSGEVLFSPVLKLKTKTSSSEGSFTVLSNCRQLRISIDQPSSFVLCNSAGTVVQSYAFSTGDHTVSVRSLAAGIYFMKNLNTRRVHKLAIL